jgi:hypothetical protein
LQSSIPTKKFEADIEIPEYYNFNLKETGYFRINSTISTRNDNIILSNNDRENRNGFSTQKIDLTKKVIKIDNENIPALIEEPYVNEITNYASTLHFELASIKWPQSPIEYFSQTWENVTKTIYKNGDFGTELEKSFYFKDDLQLLISKSGGDTNKLIVEIFEFLKQKVKWNNVA